MALGPGRNAPTRIPCTFTSWSGRLPSFQPLGRTPQTKSCSTAVLTRKKKSTIMHLMSLVSRSLSQKQILLYDAACSRRPKTAFDMLMRRIPRERKIRCHNCMRATHPCLGNSPGTKKLRERVDVPPLLKPKIRCNKPMCALDPRPRRVKSMRVSLHKKSNATIYIIMVLLFLLIFAEKVARITAMRRRRDVLHQKGLSTASWRKTVY